MAELEVVVDNLLKCEQWCGNLAWIAALLASLSLALVVLGTGVAVMAEHFPARQAGLEVLGGALFVAGLALIGFGLAHGPLMR